MNNFDYFIIPVPAYDIRNCNSLEQVKYVISEYKREEGFSTASIGKSLITLEELPKGNSVLTKHSVEDNKWVLSVDEEEWNRFVLQQLF